MSDVSLAAPTRKFDIHSAEAQARVRRRYAAERRFQAYGIAAIAFAGLFLVLLVADIVSKGLPAFFVHTVTLPVTISQDELDPGKTGNREEIAKGDFFAVARNAIRSHFPDVSDRASRRLLDGALSSSAGEAIRARVMADTKVIGQTLSFALPLSANADLYLKGDMTAIREVRGRGEAGASGTTGSVTIFSAANDFSSEVVRIKRALSDASRTVETELAVAMRNTSLLRAGEDRTALDAKIAELKARVEDFRNRAGGTAAEKLDSSLPSILVYINGGVVRATEIANDRVVGEVMVPLVNAEPAKAGSWAIRFLETPETSRKVTDKEIVWLESLKTKGLVARVFNWDFFATGDSREPELAGVLGGLAGSALTLLITLGICLPVGVLAAIYLEEFAGRDIDQQSGCRTLDCFRSARACSLPQFVRNAAVIAVGGRSGARPSGSSDNYHCFARRDEGGSSLDPRGGAGNRCFAPAGCLPACVATRHAWHHDRHDHWHGPCAG